MDTTISDPNTTATVLVLNMGSSSIKYVLMIDGKKEARGLVEISDQGSTRIRHTGPAGESEQIIEARNHADALPRILDLLTDPDQGSIKRLEDISAVGHRTVHGGTRFTKATVVTPEVKDALRDTAVLAPLHNPINLLGIEICEKLLPSTIPQVCVFDTAFHMSMPEHAYRYALPRDFADKRQLRRFGFHGTSHSYVSQTACAFLGEEPGALKLVTCHLGNGSSVAAIDEGKSVDTSMGLTPLEGLIMGTRSGDVDPGLILHLLRLGMEARDIDTLLNKQSGLKGLSGLSADMRDLERAALEGHAGARLAIASFCYRVRKYIGAYFAAMNGLNAVVFTGGIGENGVGIREQICDGLTGLGLHLDRNRNRESMAPEALAMEISTDTSRIKILVVPTDEEATIARETIRAIPRSDHPTP